MKCMDKFGWWGNARQVHVDLDVFCSSVGYLVQL